MQVDLEDVSFKDTDRRATVWSKVIGIEIRDETDGGRSGRQGSSLQTMTKEEEKTLEEHWW